MTSTNDPRPAMTMREIREGLGHTVPPAGIPEPNVLPTGYVVSCLPLGHDERWEFTINVLHQRDGLYAVKCGLRYYGADGTWSYKPGWDEEIEVHSAAADEWLAAHRFDLDTALRLAREQAARITYRGRTVADAIAESPAP